MRYVVFFLLFGSFAYGSEDGFKDQPIKYQRLNCDLEGTELYTEPEEPFYRLRMGKEFYNGTGNRDVKVYFTDTGRWLVYDKDGLHTCNYDEKIRSIDNIQHLKNWLSFYRVHLSFHEGEYSLMSVEWNEVFILPEWFNELDTTPWGYNLV
jgi:hypothetical protein